MKDDLTLGELLDALQELQQAEAKVEELEPKDWSSGDVSTDYYAACDEVEKLRSRKLSVGTNFLYERCVHLEGK